MIFKVQSSDYRSTFGKNILSLCNHARVRNLEDADICVFDAFPVPEDERWRIPLIKDLIEENLNPSNLLTRDELELLMHTVCCL